MTTTSQKIVYITNALNDLTETLQQETNTKIVAYVSNDEIIVTTEGREDVVVHDCFAMGSDADEDKLPDNVVDSDYEWDGDRDLSKYKRMSSETSLVVDLTTIAVGKTKSKSVAKHKMTATQMIAKKERERKLKELYSIIDDWASRECSTMEMLNNINQIVVGDELDR